MGTIKRRIEKLEQMSGLKQKTERVRIIHINLDGTYEYKSKIYASRKEIPEAPAGTAITIFLPRKVPEGDMGHMKG
jgi:hypothetical protein